MKLPGPAQAVRTLGRDFIARSGLASLLLRYPAGGVRIIMYHGISSAGVPAALFERQLRFFQRHFNVYWASELPGLFSGRIVPDRPPVVLTFDDGLRNNARVAAPLLEKYGLKATFYLVSDLLSGGRMMWNHELGCRLWSAQDGALPAAVPRLPGRGAGRRRVISRFITRVKQWPEEHRLELLDAVREATPNFRPEDWMKEEFEIMSAEEAKTLPRLIEVGSHTRTHPILDKVTSERAEEEIAGSKLVLEDLLGKEVRTFCYPNGQFSEEVARLVARHYDAAVTVEQGVASAGCSAHRLPRIMAGGSYPQFVAWLIRPPALRETV